MIKELLEEQKDYINDFFDKIDHKEVETILSYLLSCKGSLIFTGVGKSGLIANKLATTFISTGTRSLYISPTDALHGDIGIVTNNDILICLSKSGESKELLDLLPFAKNKGAKIIAIVSNRNSKLAINSDVFVVLPVKKEICPFNLAPTTSTSIQLIFGDILAVALMKAKNFSIDDYANNHPSGLIGKKITLRVSDIMIKDENLLPICHPQDEIIDILSCLSSKQCGAILAVDNDKLKGIFTDGDLRRSISQYKSNFLYKKIGDVMTKSFKWIEKDELAVNALKKMEEDKKLVTVLPVLENEKVIGIVRLHNIIQHGLKEK